MRRRALRRRFIMRTASPSAHATGFRVEGNVWHLTIERRDVIRVNSHVRRAYVQTPIIRRAA